MRLRISRAPLTGALDQTDRTPDAFAFSDISNAPLASLTTSDPVIISGINAASTINIAVVGTTATYSVNGGAYTSAQSTVNNGDSITLQVTSSASYSTAINVTVTVGGVSDVWTVTTQANPGNTAGVMIGFPFPLTKAA